MIRNRSLRRSLQDFRRHPWLHSVSIVTVTLALLILGGFFLCYRNLENLAERSNPKATGTLYLKDALVEGQVRDLRERVLAAGPVEVVTFKSRASVLEELQTFLGGTGTEPMPGSDLFPDVLEIELTSGVSAAETVQLKTILQKFPEVSEVDFSDDWLAQYRRVRQVLRLVGFCLMISMVIGCSFIIANFMSLRYQARREEIDIVRLIGANGRFVLTPFLWEGVLEGLFGALLALSGLALLRSALSAVVTVQWTALLGVKSWLYLSPGQAMLIVAIGIAMAVFGSFTVFLRFQERGPV